MTLDKLEESVKERLTEALKEMYLRNKVGEAVPLNIWAGIKPLKNYSYMVEGEEKFCENFPFVLIQSFAGKDEGEECSVNLKLLIGICAQTTETNEAYNNDHKDMLSIIQKIRLSFMKEKLLDSCFYLISPFKWEIYKEQPPMSLYGEISLNFKVPKINEEEYQ